MKLILSLLLVVVSLLGILDASYLTYEKLAGVIPPCGNGFNCESVLTSSWSSIGPIPLSVFGIFYYGIVFVLAVVNVLEVRSMSVAKRTLYVHDLLAALTLFGVGFSAYLVFIMGVVLQAWCLYCLISALCCTLLAILSQLHRVVTERELFIHKKKQGRFFQSLMAVIYVLVVKKVFFLFPAETMHHTHTILGVWLGKWPWSRNIVRWCFSYESKQLVKKVDGILFKNPVGLAAGFDYNGELVDVMPAVGFGFSTVGTVTLRPYDGNARPRLGRFPRSKALLVNKGFKSLGAAAVIASLENREFVTPVGISIGSTNMSFRSVQEQILDIVSTFKLFEKSHVRHSHYELNISCPNTQGGQPFTTPARLRKLLAALQPLKIGRPVYVKMPIDLPEKESLGLLEVLKPSFVCGVVFGNLTKDHTNPDVHPEDRMLWKGMAGNVSGRPTWHRSNALVALTKKTYGKRFTIIGTGGIFSPEDANEKMRLGADLVQLITGMIYEGPQLIGEINYVLAADVARAAKKPRT